MNDTTIMTDDDVAIRLPKNIHIGILASDQRYNRAFVIVGFDTRVFLFGNTTDEARSMAVQILKSADIADKENGIFSPKKAENILCGYLAEMQATL